jgi:hypothetical protein
MFKGIPIAALATLVASLTVPFLPRTAAAQSAIVYPWCGEYGDSVEECAYTSFAQCRTGNRLCAPNGMYYLRDSSVYAAAPFANGAASPWNSTPYTYAPATDDSPQRRRR